MLADINIDGTLDLLSASPGRGLASIRLGSADLGSQVSVRSSASRCAEELAEIVDGGGPMLMLNPVFDQMEHLEELRRMFPDVSERRSRVMVA